MIRFAAVGLDHRHIFEQVGRLIELGCECAGYWTDGAPQPLEGFVKRFPGLARVDDPALFYDDTSIQLIVTAAIPCARASIALRAMRAGKDVMSDKPGCTTPDQLAQLRQCQAETGRIWSVNFSERFEVPAVEKAMSLIRDGRIGKVVQTLGMGPHRLNKHLRPGWFFEPDAYGGVLTDIASHQIDQFLYLTGSSDAEIVATSIANHANPDRPGLEDFGEILLRNNHAHGYIRVDWYTPDGLPSWGDGRLMILGTEGYIELRKYLDIGARSGGNHLLISDRQKTEYIDCSNEPLHYYPRLVADILNRTETAMRQDHCFRVMELALEAQIKATRLGHLA